MGVPQKREVQLGKVLDFMRLLWAVDHGLQSGSKRMEAAMGLTGPQRMVVRILGRFPGISAGSLAAVLHIHPSTLTGILQRLEKRGIVVRAADPQDGRRALLRLTPKGETLNTKREGTVESVVRRALTRLSAAELSAASRVFVALADELEKGP